MPDKKYLSKIVKGGNTLYLKDAEARQDIADIKSSITGAMHWLGYTTSSISDGSTTNPIIIEEESVTAKSGDVVAVAGSGSGAAADKEFVFNGTKWQEYGSTGSLKALAFKDSASGSYTPAGTNAPSAVSFTGQTSGNFVTGYNDDAVAPSLGAATTGSFVTGFQTSPVAPSFSEGAFTPAEIQAGFVTAGSAASYSHSGFSGGSLGSETKSSFATEGETSVYDEANETLTFSDAGTAQAVTAQGTFTPAIYGTDTFDGGTPTAIDVTKFSGGSKANDTFNAGTVPTLATDTAVTAQGTFSAGSAATLAVGSAVTAVGTGEAAAQTFSGTQDTVTVS